MDNRTRIHGAAPDHYLFCRWVGINIGPLVLCLIIFLFLLGMNGIALASQAEDATPLTKYVSLGVKTKRLLNSHTSYEFGNPFPPYQAPLSRLEFPLDSWWGGVEVRASFPRFSAGIEVLRNVLGDADGRMRDSDWDDDARPDMRTIYSEPRCRIEPSYMVRADVDLEISDWLSLPQWFSLRPVVGFRLQNFHFMVHDGVQYTLGSDSQSLPGNTLRFKQMYSQYFMGFRSNIDVGWIVGIKDLQLLMQIDWAYVEGQNEDNHIARAGSRFTYEYTYGDAWHASVGLKKALLKGFVLGIEAEYLRIDTTGSHRLINEPLGIDFGVSNGVKVWSEQVSISMSLEYRF